MSQLNVPSRRHASPARSADPAPEVVASVRKRTRRIVTQVAHGTMFAVGLALAQNDVEELFFKKKFFEPGVVDRLHTQITRYHE